MGIIFNLFLLSIGSIFGSVYLNKRYEEMVPMTVMVIIFTLFIFYMLNIVLIGYYLILIAGAVLITLSAIKFFKQKDIRKQALKNFFTPGLLIFAVLLIMIYIVTKDNFVMLFDELRLWALYPKSIFVENRLMLGSGLNFSSDYYPGMPLFQYFFARNAGFFAESHLYLSYALVVLSLIIPITKKIKWKHFWAIIPTILLLFTFPMLFANSGFDMEYYYKSLYIDSALGIAFGYSLFLSTQDLKKDKYKYILFCLSLCTVILMKVIGVVLVACIILSYLFNQLFIYKSYKLKINFKKDTIKNFGILIIPILIAIFTFISWQFVIKMNTHIDSKSAIMSSSRVKDSIQLFFNPNEKQKEFINSYVTNIKDYTLLYNNDSIYASKATVPNVSIFFLIIMCIMFFSVIKEKRKIIVSSSIFGIFSIFIFLLLYLYIYVFTFHSTILCYGRYIGTVISGISVLALLLIFDMSYKVKNIPLFYFLLSLLSLIYFSNLPKVSTELFRQNVEVETKNLENKVLSTFSDKSKNINLFTIYNYCDTVDYTCLLYQHHLFLSLYDKHIYPLVDGMYLSGGGPFNSNFDFPIDFKNIDLHLKNYDYILIIEDIKNINPESEKLLGSSPRAGEIYKKTIDETGNILLKKITN